MAVVVDDLKNVVIENTKASDRTVIISGFATPDTIEEIADQGVQTSFYYGMYRKTGLTELTYKKYRNIELTHPKLEIYVVNDYHVHSKCYFFYEKNTLTNALIGSANCSRDGLSSGPNSEMLVELNRHELKRDNYLSQLENYISEIATASVRCDDPSVVVLPSNVSPVLPDKPGHYPDTSNPNVVYMPLYTWSKNEFGELKKVVPLHSGLNWGLQKGHSKRGSFYAEAYFSITADLVDSHPNFFPPVPTFRKTMTGKITRRYDPVTVLWDDGTVMSMIFSGDGVERPKKRKDRTSPSSVLRYPKQMTDGTGGGSVLGEYLRKRMNVSERHIITIEDLQDYGRECIEIYYVHDGYYEANFSGSKFKQTRF